MHGYTKCHVSTKSTPIVVTYAWHQWGCRDAFTNRAANHIPGIIQAYNKFLNSRLLVLTYSEPGKYILWYWYLGCKLIIKGQVQNTCCITEELKSAIITII